MFFMRGNTIHNEIRSVLNTDAFDKRRFNEIYEMSQGLQKISDEGGITNVRTITC